MVDFRKTEHSIKEDKIKDVFNVQIKRESLENVPVVTQQKIDVTNKLSLEKEKVPESIPKQPKVPEKRNLANCDFELQKMGNFFEDSYFTDLHQHFHSAIKNVLEKFNKSSTSFSEDLSKYTDMRNLNLSQENQAVRMIEDNQCYTVSFNIKFNLNHQFYFQFHN